MKEIAPNTPVIVGIGFHQERTEDPTQCPEPYQLMVRAVRAAADDAGSRELLGQIESVSVPQGMWQYRNPGKLIAEALGCPKAKSIISDLGVLQLTLLSDLCRAIAAGEQELGVVTGGEAQFRELRSMITQHPVTDTQQPEDTTPPDVHHTSQDPFCSDLEGQRGLHLPAELFAIIESALRFHEHLSIAEHRDKIARLYSSFSEIAAANPHAWRREPMSAEEIRNADREEHHGGVSVHQAPLQQLERQQRRRHPRLLGGEGRAVRPGSRRVGSIRWRRRSRSTLSSWRSSDSCTAIAGTVLCGERALALAGVSTEGR